MGIRRERRFSFVDECCGAYFLEDSVIVIT